MTDMTAYDSVGSAEFARVTMRHYLSTGHLYAGRYAAENAQEREDALLQQAPLFDMRHFCSVISAVMESVAFLEAAINEVFQDVADNYQHHVSQLDSNCRELMAALWIATRNGRIDILDKYDFALRFGKHGGLDKARRPYQDVKALVELRNHIAHYRPEEVGVDIEHKLAEQLRGRFPRNALMANSGNPDFPSHLLGAGCANWSWRSARAFADEFALTMGIQLNHQRFDYGDPLPA